MCEYVYACVWEGGCTFLWVERATEREGGHVGCVYKCVWSRICTNLVTYANMYAQGTLDLPVF